MTDATLARPATNPAFIDLAHLSGAAGRWDSQPGWHLFFGSKFLSTSILDVGAGLGHSRDRLAGPGRSNVVVLQDLAPDMPVDWRCPIEVIPDRSFDVVTAFDVIEHIHNDEAFLAELCRIARQAVVITTPNWRVSKCGNPFHVREYTPEQLLELVRPHAVLGLYTDLDGSGCRARHHDGTSFLATDEAALGIVIDPASGQAPVQSVPARSVSVAPDLHEEIWIGGFPSPYGGADTELDHMIDLWRGYDIGVHLVANGEPDPLMLSGVLARGCEVHSYKPDIFAGKVVASYCNGEFLKRLPEICANGRPACVLWANCMTWNFDEELAAHAAGCIDLHIFHSDYQRSMVAPALQALNPVRELAGYRPFFNVQNAMQQLRFDYRDPAHQGYFGMGRVSRDDGYKYPHDMWKMFAQVTSPLPTKTFVLGYGANAAAKCGPVPCNWLDWMTWAPGGTTPAELYRRIHVLMHRTGGSRENWPRTVLEAMASGVAVLVEDDFAMPQLIENGVTGFLCRSTEEMSFRASQLAFDEPLRRRMVHAAYERFLAEHANPERSFAAWQGLLVPGRHP